MAENENVKKANVAEERKRAEMHRTYGMWYKEEIGRAHV